MPIEIKSVIVKRFLFSLLGIVSLTAARAGEDFTVLPRFISLTGPGASAGVLVQRTLTSDGLDSPTVGAQISSGIELEVANPNIAKVADGAIQAVADGTTELVVKVAGFPRVARIPLIVRAASDPKRWQFSAHVESVLARHGCNSGACHGALAGKGGFRLSLLGYDPGADLQSIAVQDQGRRIEPADPLASLLLTKPSMQVPHKGGLRLSPDSADYRLLAEWIAAGSPGPAATDSPLQGIEVFPKTFRSEVDGKQRLLVLAHYADGRVEDVTRWAKFSSTNGAVAEVDEAGNARVLGNGRGAIVAWFASRICLAFVDAPFRPVDTLKDDASSGAEHVAFSGERGEPWQPVNLIDQHLADEWKLLGLTPSPACDDLTFLRRAYLDATGSIPDAEVVSQLLESGVPLDRGKLIDELLNSPAFIDYWAYQWSDLLLVNGNLLRPKAVEAFYLWIRSQVEANTPWDEFARAIVLARGDSFKNGATNFYAIHQTPEAMTENTCLAFMGLSIECAKCHNHPLERWTNDQYYAMANLFARVRAKGWGGDPRNGEGDRTLVVLERGDLIQPSRGKPQPPAALDQPAMDSHDPSDRRGSLANWLTSPENSYFSRAIVNRIWSNFMGIGLVDPVDDLRASNPASSEPTLQALTEFLIDQDYDLKSLMRLIMNSRVYQLSSQTTEHNRSDARFYCRYYPRRLTAEVLHDAVVQVTGVPTAFDKIEFVGADKQPTGFYPLGTKALGLYDSAVSSYFLQTFGRHQRRITCDCERSNEPTVVQALHLKNGDTLNAKLSHADCIVSNWLNAALSLDAIIDQSYIRALTRPPTEREREKIHLEFQSAAADGVSLREFVEDLLWSLMSSPEFMFAH